MGFFCYLFHVFIWIICKLQHLLERSQYGILCWYTAVIIAIYTEYRKCATLADSLSSVLWLLYNLPLYQYLTGQWELSFSRRWSHVSKGNKCFHGYLIFPYFYLYFQTLLSKNMFGLYHSSLIFCLTFFLWVFVLYTWIDLFSTLKVPYCLRPPVFLRGSQQALCNILWLSGYSQGFVLRLWYACLFTMIWICCFVWPSVVGFWKAVLREL